MNVRNIVTDDAHQQVMSITNENNALILPTYDDEESILNPHSITSKKLRGHIKPQPLIQNNGNNVSLISSGECTITVERTQPQQCVPQ